MTSAEFADWMAFGRLEPFGSVIDDSRAGTIASAVTRPWGGKNDPDDWFRWDGRPRRAEVPTGDWRHIRAGFTPFVKKPGEGAGDRGKNDDRTNGARPDDRGR